MKKRILLAVAVLSFVSANGNAGEITDTSRVYDIDEVVVVEQPKESARLRLQPLSSSSFSARSLSTLGTQDLRQLSAFVPSFVMPDYGSRITSAIYVRGIGSRVNSPAVGLYLDDMPLQSKSAFNFHTYDLKRIDILRGPQGTLYGMNTEGGLVRMYTKDPFDYQGTDINLSLGNKLWRKAEVSHYARLSDKFAYSLAGFYDGQNGFLKNQYNGERADKFNEFGFRARGIWKPTKRLTLGLIADYQFVRQNGFPYGRLYSEEDVANADITSPLYHVKAGTQEPNQNRQSNYQRNILNTGLSVKYAGRGFDINSMTSYQFLRDNMLMDIDYLPADYMYMTQHQLQNSLTEELSIKSKNHSFWHWSFSAFASYGWLRTEAPVYFESAMNSMLSARLSAMANKAMGMPGMAKIDVDLGSVPGLFHTPTYNLGLSHESNIDITDHLTATLGLRYDYSHVAIDYATSSLAKMSATVFGMTLTPSISSVLNHHEDNHFNEFLPKVGLTYKFNDGSNVYAVWSKGYRSGGYNIQMFSDILQTEVQTKARTARSNDVITVDHDAADYDRIRKTIEYKPETSFNYEVGAHLNLFNHQVHLDIAAFYMQIHDQQISVMAGNYGFGRAMTNAGKSHSTGMEITLRGAALDSKLNYMLGYGFTSAEFDEYIDSTASGKRVDYKNHHVPFVPQHTLAASIDYRFDINPDALLDASNKFHLRSITGGLNLSGQGQTWWNEDNNIKQRFYAVLGAHADADFGPLDINVWIRNLTNTKYNTFAVQSAATGQTLTFAQRGFPTQVGVDVRFHF